MAMKKILPKVGVVGSGSFATAVVKMLTENCGKSTLVVDGRRNERIFVRARKKSELFTAVKFNPYQLVLTMDINELVTACDVIILATPSIYLAKALEKMTCDYSGKIFASVIKGIVPEHNDIA